MCCTRHVHIVRGQEQIHCSSCHNGSSVNVSHPDPTAISSIYPFPKPLDAGTIKRHFDEFKANNVAVAQGCPGFLLPLPGKFSTEELSNERQALEKALSFRKRGFTNANLFLSPAVTTIHVHNRDEIDRKNGKPVPETNFEVNDSKLKAIALHAKMGNSGYFPALTVREIDLGLGSKQKEYGVFATSPIPKNTYLCGYTGSIHSLRECLFDSDEDDNFELTYKASSANCAVVKARYAANIARFVNKSDTAQGTRANVKVERFVKSTRDLEHPAKAMDDRDGQQIEIMLISQDDIDKNDQLLYNYNSKNVRHNF